MKRTFIILIMLTICSIMMAQEITVRFTGQLNGNEYCRLDSVAVTNITHNWSEFVAYPDTIIVLGSTVNANLNPTVLQGLGQNIPNPFDCETRVELAVSQREDVSMQLLDAAGKLYATYNGMLDAGMHIFDISAANPQTYLLNAMVGSHQYSIRMVNVGSGCGCSIKYAGSSNGIEAKLTTTNEFQIGDNMRYVGYASIGGEIVESVAMEQIQTTSEDVTLNFTVCQPLAGLVEVTACDTYEWNSETYTESGDYQQIFTASNGCDSVVTLHLTINHSNTGIDEQTACDSYIWIDGVTYTASTNEPTFILTNSEGCDSVVTLHLTINYSNTGVDEQTACDSYTWIDGITYTASTNEPIFALTNAEGCDSVVTLHLTINHSNTGVDEQTACDSYTWIDGITYTASTNEPTFTLTNTEGCDSVVTLHLTINHSNTGVDEQTACDSYTWIDGNTYTASTNEPTYTLTNVTGCDSVVTLHLTMACSPMVQTVMATNITTTEATLSGNVTSDGGANVTERGFVYGTSENNLTQTIQSGNGTGSFTADLIGLSSSTRYYYKAYATNSIGTAYGELLTFKTKCECGGSYIVTDVNGNQYGTVLIGEQCWMTENLKATKFADGANIPLGSETSSTTAYRYNPNNNSSNVSAYGYLYNWQAAMHGASASSSNPSNVQGICPNGWHLPSYAEWTQLADYVSSQSEYHCGGNSTYIAKSLASTTGWSRTSTTTCAVGNNPADNNSTGFSAMPAGYCLNGYGYFGTHAYYWSSTEDSTITASCFSLNYDCDHIYRNIDYKEYGRAVRCVKDDGADSSTASLPSVTTAIVNGITSNAAVGGGIVTSDGGATVIAHGVCWSTSQNPTISDNHTTDGTGAGSFTSYIIGLAQSTTYYVRAYATNRVGTAYGELMPFTTRQCECGGSYKVTDIDGNQYGTVIIGEQCWMSENLKTTRFADGTNIALGSETNSTTAYRYYPGNNSSNVSTCGYLYNWPATMHGANSSNSNPSNVQGVCPNGWHLPSDAEWTQLTDYLSSQNEYRCSNNSTYIAKSLASTTGWSSSSTTCAVGNNPANNNSSGFGVLPAGGYNGSYYYFGSRAHLWSATESEGSNAYYFGIYNFSAEVGRHDDNKYNGRPVRCVKDE